MVEITVVAEDELQPVDLKDTLDELGGPKDWKFSYELGPASLKDFNPLPLLQQVLSTDIIVKLTKQNRMEK